MMFALRQDVVPIRSSSGARSTSSTDGSIEDFITTDGSLVTATQASGGNQGNLRRNAKLRDDKRPRPLVLRVAEGDCLTVNFQNLLNPVANPLNAPVDRDGIGNDPNPVTADGTPQITTFVDEQVADRRASFHASGMQLRSVGGIANDGSFVGRNASSLAAPGERRTYQLFAEKEQVYQVVSMGPLVGSDANQGNIANGLFGQIIVEPKGARIYRNTVTEPELRLATRTASRTGASCPRLGDPVPGSNRDRYCLTAGGHPVLNYEAVYPNGNPWNQEGKAGRTILNMIQNNRIVHTEVDAVIAGPNADGSFPASTYPLEAAGKRNPAYPNRSVTSRSCGMTRSARHRPTRASTTGPASCRPPARIPIR
jgi:manganese oxidase